MKWCSGVLVVASLVSLPVFAEVLPPAKAQSLLVRMVEAARKLDYAGSYVYQRGGRIEAFQLVHIEDAKGEAERRESLDGPPKLMLREGENITCYMPDAKYVNLDRHSVTKLFPALLPDDVGDLLKVYDVQTQADERVAGIDAQVVLLTPKDGLRYPYRLWFDPASGLIVKATLLAPNLESIVEQFSFTQLQVGGNISRKDLKPHLKDRDFKVYAAAEKRRNNAIKDFDIRGVPAGYRLVNVATRSMPSGELTHVMFTDGLSAVSVFIEPLSREQKAVQGHSAQDATHMVAKAVGNFQITVMGEAPESTIQQFAKGVVARGQ